MRNTSSLPRVTILLIAATQGLLLFALYLALDNRTWPSQSPLWSVSLSTLAVFVPLLLMLSIERGTVWRAGRLVSLLGIVLFATAAYTGFQAEPYKAFPPPALSFFVFGLTTTIACFKALMYLQQRSAGVPLSYQVLFSNSWRNFLVVAFAGLFLLVFYLILLLWASLFRMLGIGFFHELFSSSWFLVPVSALAFGLGIVIFRDLSNIIAAFTTMLHGLLRLLLPLVVLISVMFLATLSVVGLDPLWSGRSGTGVLLWLLAFLLFFVNAVYQDGRETQPYSPLVHRLISIGLCTMPVISALSLYGLLLRVGQYGWSVDRCWAATIWLLLTLFAVGYYLFFTAAPTQ